MLEEITDNIEILNGFEDAPDIRPILMAFQNAKVAIENAHHRRQFPRD